MSDLAVALVAGLLIVIGAVMIIVGGDQGSNDS